MNTTISDKTPGGDGRYVFGLITSFTAAAIVAGIALWQMGPETVQTSSDSPALASAPVALPGEAGAPAVAESATRGDSMRATTLVPPLYIVGSDPDKKELVQEFDEIAAIEGISHFEAPKVLVVDTAEQRKGYEILLSEPAVELIDLRM